VPGFLYFLAAKPHSVNAKEFFVKNQLKKAKMFGWIVFYVLLAFLLALSGCGSMPFGTSPSSSASTNTIEIERATLLDLKRITEDGLSKDWLNVSPNGNMLLYCESRVPLKRWSDISNKRITSFQIALLRDAQKSATTQLVTDKSIAPAWYSNEAFVYSVIESNVPKLIKSNIAGGGKVYITRSNNVGQYDVRPSVNGNLILADTEINKVPQIIRMTDTGSNVTMLGEGESPSWHPRNSQRFVYVKNGDIYEFDLNTNQSTKLYGEQNIRCANPKYHSTGNYILFQKEHMVRIIDSKTGKQSKETKHWHAFVIKVDGSDLVQLTNGDVDCFSPVWGRDNTIFFVSNANNSTEIWSARVNLNEIYRR
jgi:TolB protein